MIWGSVSSMILLTLPFGVSIAAGLIDKTLFVLDDHGNEKELV